MGFMEENIGCCHVKTSSPELEVLVLWQTASLIDPNIYPSGQLWGKSLQIALFWNIWKYITGFRNLESSEIVKQKACRFHEVSENDARETPKSQ